MITRFREVLTSRIDARKNGDAGFTLIELLVVVLIIGILAAIAIPVFLSQQTSAKDGAAKSDLGNAKAAVISYETQNGAWPASVTDLSSQGFTATAGDTVTLIKASSTDICISASASGGSGTFYITQSGGVSTTACS